MMQLRYAREEPSLRYPGKTDVAVYYDPECKQQLARYEWHNHNKPTRDTKYFMDHPWLPLVWVDDLEGG